MRLPDATARQVLRAYREAGRKATAHTTLRWIGCPFARLESFVPPRARVLDYGCGHGHFAMYLALRSPDRHVVGVDIDSRKLALGTRVVTRAGLGGRVELVNVGDGWTPDAGAFDAVVTNDVLYLLGRRRADEVVDELCAAVAPAGTLVVKEVDTRPRWKSAISHVEERLAVRLGITAGAVVELLDLPVVADRMRTHGLAVERHELGRGYPAAHVALVGTRPAA